MSDLPVIVILTASGCHVCDTMKKSGTFSYGEVIDQPSAYFFGHKWNSFFFWKMLTGYFDPCEHMELHDNVVLPPYFRVYELCQAFGTRDVKDAREFTEFTLIQDDEGADITRTRHTRYYNGTPGVTMLMKTRDLDTPIKTNLTFVEEVERTFPNRLSAYMSIFPCFLMFSASEWNRALSEESYTPRGVCISENVETIKENDTYILRTKQGRPYIPTDPAMFAERVRQGFISL